MISGQASHPLEEYLRVAYTHLPIFSVLLLAVIAIILAWSFQRTRSAIVCLSTTPWLSVLFVLSLVLFAASATQLVGYQAAALYLGSFGFLLSGFLIVPLTVSSKIFASNIFSYTWEVSDRSSFSLTNKHVFILLAAMMLLVFADRFHTYGEAYERDLMVYMTIADRLLDGWPLYSVLWDHKPPAIHWTYASFVALFGVTPLSLFLLGYSAFVVTLFGCYVAGKQLRGKLSGLLSAAVWSLINGDIFLQANQPNVEVFVNACLVWAIALVLEEAERTSVLRYAFIGFLFFVSTLYKTNAITVPFLVLLTHLLYSAFQPGWNWGSSYRFRVGLSQVFASGVVAAGGWAVVFIAFFIIGEFDDFRMAVFDYNREYAGDIFKNIAVSLLPGYWTPWLLPYGWLLLSVLTFSIFLATNRRDRKAGIILAYFVGTWLAVALPGKFFPHYYQLLLPPIAIVAGWLGAAVLLANKRPFAVLYVTLLALPFAARVFQTLIPINEVPIAKYGDQGFEFLETKNIAEWINNNLAREAIIYNWGGRTWCVLLESAAKPVWIRV